MILNIIHNIIIFVNHKLSYTGITLVQLKINPSDITEILLYNTIILTVPSERMGTLGSYPGSDEHRGPMLIYVCCLQHVFLNVNGNANTINICLILSNRYIFI